MLRDNSRLCRNLSFCILSQWRRLCVFYAILHLFDINFIRRYLANLVISYVLAFFFFPSSFQIFYVQLRDKIYLVWSGKIEENPLRLHFIFCRKSRYLGACIRLWIVHSFVQFDDFFEKPGCNWTVYLPNNQISTSKLVFFWGNGHKVRTWCERLYEKITLIYYSNDFLLFLRLLNKIFIYFHFWQ